MPERALERHNPNTFLEFKKRIKYNIAHLAELNQAAGSCVIQILNEDTRTQTSIPAKSVDLVLVVSSPPYGDSKTTVAYGQFSRLSLEFLGYDECFIRKIDKISLGEISAKDFCVPLSSSTLTKEVLNIQKIDEKRALEVMSFYQDFIKCILEIDRVMKVGGYDTVPLSQAFLSSCKLIHDNY